MDSDQAVPWYSLKKEKMMIYTYPEEFVRKPEEQQVEILCKKVLKIDPAPVVDHLSNFFGSPSLLPPGCHPQDGKFAILSPFGAKLLVSGYEDPFDPQLYCKTLLHLFESIQKDRSFVNYRSGKVDEKHLLQTTRTLDFYKTIAGVQGGSPVWIIDAQLGFLHKGESVEKMKETFMDNEFGFGSVAMASITKTHPKRYFHFEELDTDCVGDEFAPDADGVFSRAPVFNFDGGELWFDTRDVSHARDRYGAVSAFVPQN
jgi:hypothetical protein